MSMTSICLILSLAVTSQPQGKKADWKTATSNEGGFSVSMPGTSIEQKMKQDTPEGPVDMNMVVCQADQGVIYVAMRADTGKPVPMNGCTTRFWQI